MPDTAAFLRPDVDCVKALQSSTRRNDSIFQDPKNASVASAMSMLSHTAQFIEQHVNSNQQMHNLSILIACKVRKGNEATGNPTFVLWNTITKPAQNVRNANTVQPAPQISVQTDRTAAIRGKPNLTELTEPSSGQRDSQSPPTEPQQLPEGDEAYTVPVPIASTCLQLLFDGSGFSSHKNIFQKPSYSEIGSKLLEDVIRKVFKAEGDRRSGRLDPSSPRSSTDRTLRGNEMIYSDLLPDHLRQKKGEGDIRVSVPEITFSRNGNPVVSNAMKVSMSTKKPDRNTKTQNFALLCSNLDHTGPQGICAKTLREYANEGFSHEGCKRRKKFSTSVKSTCNGAQACGRSTMQLSTFYIHSSEKPVAVGMGTVDPFISSCGGREIPEGHFHIRFNSVTNIEEISFPPNVIEKERIDTHLKWKSGPSIWEKVYIERVQLLGAKRLTDGSNTIVICDVTLREDHEPKPPERYP